MSQVSMGTVYLSAQELASFQNNITGTVRTIAAATAAFALLSATLASNGCFVLGAAASLPVFAGVFLINDLNIIYDRTNNDIPNLDQNNYFKQTALLKHLPEDLRKNLVLNELPDCQSTIRDLFNQAITQGRAFANRAYTAFQNYRESLSAE